MSSVHTGLREKQGLTCGRVSQSPGKLAQAPGDSGTCWGEGHVPSTRCSSSSSSSRVQ